MSDRQRKHWNAVAAGWGSWLEWTRRNFAPLTAWLHHTADWKPGARVLDVACGAGYPAIDAAAAVRPGGQVVAVDLSSEMIAVAAERAAALGVGGIEFRQMDAEALGFEDRSFEAVINTYGLMFCPDPAAAVREAHRVLVPGGRVAIAVWDELSRSSFFTTMMGVAGRLLGLPEPPPDEPHPFRLASAGALTSLVEAAGFVDVRVESLPMTFDCASVAEYCQLFADVAMRRIAALPPDEAARFKDAVIEAARPYTAANGRVRTTTASLCASGRKT